MSDPMYNVPMALDDSHTHTRGFRPEDARDRVDQNAKDAPGFMLGPMPVLDFLNDFLPNADGDAAASVFDERAFAAVPALASSVEEVCEPLLVALNKHAKDEPCCPSLTFADIPGLAGLEERTIACYASSTSLASNGIIPALGYAELLITVSPDSSQDPFISGTSGTFLPTLNEDDEDDDAEDDSKRPHRTIGRHVDLISELMARQHREFAFSISLHGTHARLFRWDRAGCIVTESFDLHSSPELLCQFLSRFAKAPPASRGYDPTIGPASPEEELIFKEAVTRHVQYQLGLTGEELHKAVSEHYAPGRVVAIQIVTVDPLSNTTHIRRFLVSRPVVSPSSLTGRCTRGFWAVDPTSSQVTFVKDTWRSPDLEPEGAVISHLLAVGVRNIPEVVCHGDVCVGGKIATSVTDRYQRCAWYADRESDKSSLSTQIHYRIVLGTVGYGLQHFRGTEELLHATYDAFEAMRDAFDKDSRIHRDISLGNIILVKDSSRSVRRGYLIDWEVSSKVDSDGRSLDHAHVGTWYYLSWNILLRPEAIHTLEDDMESLIWIVLYCALRWLPHSISTTKLRKLLHDMFERSITICNVTYGGEAKLHNMKDRRFTRNITLQPQVQTWLQTVMDYQYTPPRCRQGPEVDRWTDPVHLNLFWSQFLQTQRLPSNDRVEHRLEPPQSLFVPPVAPSPEIAAHPPSRPSTKRSEPAVPEEPSGSESKRRKPSPVPPQPQARPARRSRSRATAKLPTRRSRRAPQQKASSAEPRYFLRSPDEVVSKYRRAHSR